MVADGISGGITPNFSQAQLAKLNLGKQCGKTVDKEKQASFRKSFNEQKSFNNIPVGASSTEIKINPKIMQAIEYLDKHPRLFDSMKTAVDNKTPWTDDDKLSHWLGY